jgi:hypothetical protein
MRPEGGLPIAGDLQDGSTVSVEKVVNGSIKLRSTLAAQHIEVAVAAVRASKIAVFVEAEIEVNERLSAGEYCRR